MKHRIVVLGAGYAGTNTAGRLAKRLHADDIDITVVNADPEFVERVRLHQLATGQELAPRPLTEVFANTGVRLRIARVTAINAEQKTVDLVDDQGTDTLTYDTLVYALGSTSADHGVPGVREYASHMASKTGALALRDRLAGLTEGERVLVVGGGLTGIEAVTEIAEIRPDLSVSIATDGGTGDWLSAKGQRHLQTVYDRLRITAYENITVTRVTPTGVHTKTGQEIPAQVTIWSTGFAVHPLAAASTLEVSSTGQIVVDDTMRSVSHPEVYAVGDAGITAGAGGSPLRMACASGVPMAWAAADAIAARLTGGKVPHNPIGYNAQCISLGRRDGLIQRVTPDDQATPSALTGAAAARVKELICTAAAWSTNHPTMLKPTRRRRVNLASQPESYPVSA